MHGNGGLLLPCVVPSEPLCICQKAKTKWSGISEDNNNKIIWIKHKNAMGSTASPQNIRHRNLHAYTTRITCNYGAHSVFFFLRVLWWLLLFRLCLCIRERACGNTAIECIGGIKSHFTKFLPSYCYYYAKTKCSENWLQPRLQHVILYRLAFGRSIVGCRLLASHKCTFIPTNTCTFGVCVFVVVPFLFLFFFYIALMILTARSSRTSN